MLAALKYHLLRNWVRRAARSHSPAGDRLTEIHRIALWQFGGLGDMLLTTPVIRALTDAYPDAQIHLWCSDPPFADFLGRFPAIAQIHRFPVYWFDGRTLFQRPVRDALRVVRDGMLEMDADLVINLHIPALLDWWVVEWWLVRQLSVPRSIGFDPRFIRKGSVYSTSLNASARDGLHYTVLYKRLLEHAGIPSDARTEFPLTDADRERAAALLAASGPVSERRRVCLHPGGRRLQMEGRMWPIGCFAELARRLLEDGMMPVLIGAEMERAMGEELCAMAPGCIDLIGRTQIGEMAALISMAEGFIGHDSGPFHVAAAVGTPCVAICGRPDAEPEYLNYQRDDVFVVTADSPQAIEVDVVFKCAMRMLTRV